MHGQVPANTETWKYYLKYLRGVKVFKALLIASEWIEVQKDRNQARQMYKGIDIHCD